MPRRWTSVDVETTNREFDALPYEDRRALFEAIKPYRMEPGSGYEVDGYGGGLYRLKPNNRTQGRRLFFTEQKRDGVTVLVALLS